jgi:hypothetical protein
VTNAPHTGSYIVALRLAPYVLDIGLL